MGNFSWLLGPLAVLLIMVVGYGSMDMVNGQSGSWVDCLFWAMMALGTLPAFVLLAWLQAQWLLRFLDRPVGRTPRHRRHAARV